MGKRSTNIRWSKGPGRRGKRQEGGKAGGEESERKFYLSIRRKRGRQKTGKHYQKSSRRIENARVNETQSKMKDRGRGKKKKKKGREAKRKSFAMQLTRTSIGKGSRPQFAIRITRVRVGQGI